MAQNIPKDFIDNLLEKVNIVDVIGNYIKLEKKGNDYWARCPFHSEKTSSFSVSENKQFFHCFGCGAHGNSIGFVMDHSNKTYPEAIETIANSLGIEIPRDKESTKKFEAKKIIQNSLEDAKKQFEKQLKNSEKAISYLKDRNISGETAKLFNIGYADDNFQALIKNLEKKYTELNLLDAGLIVKKENKTYDKFRHRIMFPIHDVSGKTIAFGGRIIEENLKIPAAKYMNSPETPLFSKKKVLYNLNLAKQTKESRESLYVVEGYMDVIALHQADIKNTVATLGTAVTQENLLQCFKYTKEIICCFDGDQAGKKAAWQGVENIMPIIKDGDVISFVFLPEGKDPDNIVNKGGKNHWNELVNKKISLIRYKYCCW
jgi:DNA primase